VDAKLPEPSEVEVSAIYAVQKEQLNPPFDEVKAQIQQNLKRAKIRKPARTILTDSANGPR